MQPSSRFTRSAAATTDDNVSLMTLHSLDEQPQPPPPRRSGRKRQDSSRLPHPDPYRLIIQRPDSLAPSAAPSSRTSNAPSLIIQNPDDPSRPDTAATEASVVQKKEKKSKLERMVPDYEGPKAGKKAEKQSKLERLVPDYRPQTSATTESNLTAETRATAATATTDLSTITDTSTVEHEESLLPPKFTIDLSKPPRERYDHVAPHFRAHNKALQRLFDDLVRDGTKKKADVGRKWGKRLLKRIPSQEEQEEIEGMAEAWGVELYLLIAFNVLLDSFMGCTSGGVRVKDLAQDEDPVSSRTRKGRTKQTRAPVQQPVLDDADSRGRMLHFRTLDWAMDPLRRLVCHYEYVHFPGGDVFARSVTYFGFVGVLTGVRRGLSVSLNFRPCHDASTLWKRAAFRFHQLMVLLGYRRSIASELRDCLLPSKYEPMRFLPSLVDIERDMPKVRSTAAYLIFSDGARTTTMEKDYCTAVVRSASDFIVALNHDVADECGRIDPISRTGTADPLVPGIGTPSPFSSATNSRHASPSPGPSGRHLTPGSRRVTDAAAASDDALATMQADSGRQVTDTALLQTIGLGSLVEGSKARKRCVARHWKNSKARRGRAAVRTEDVLEWMKDPELCSDETHYACVMDPTKGDIVWIKRWTVPLRPSDPR